MNISERVKDFFDKGVTDVSSTKANGRPGGIVRSIVNLVAIGAVTVPLAACGTMEGLGTKQIFGGVGGAALGGLAGAQFGQGQGKLIATAAGAVVGLLIGSEIGSSLDKADRLYAQQAEVKAHTAPVGQTVVWDNPQSGHRGTITPTRQGRNNNGQVCREYTSTVTIGGKTEQLVGVACRRQDGSWEAADASEAARSFAWDDAAQGPRFA